MLQILEDDINYLQYNQSDLKQWCCDHCKCEFEVRIFSLRDGGHVGPLYCPNCGL